MRNYRQYLAADLEKAGLSSRPSETQQTVVRRPAAAAPTARGGSQRESEDAPAWARAVERISQTGTSSAQQSSYYVEDELDADYEGGYDNSDDDYENVQADSRPTDSGVPAWLNNKRSSSREPTAPTSARPYSINLTGAAQQQGAGQYYDDQGYEQGYEDQYYDDQNPYDYDNNYDDQGADDDEYAADHQTYNNARTQAARRYQDEEAYEDDNCEYEDIDPRQVSPPPERTMSNPDRVPPPIPSSKPVDNEPVPAWAAEPRPEQKQQETVEPVAATTAPKPRAVDEYVLGLRLCLPLSLVVTLPRCAQDNAEVCQVFVGPVGDGGHARVCDGDHRHGGRVQGQVQVFRRAICHVRRWAMRCEFSQRG